MKKRFSKTRLEHPKIEHSTTNRAPVWTLDPALTSWQQKVEIISLLKEIRDELKKRH